MTTLTGYPNKTDRQEAIRRLRAIESEHDVRVVYACESGSRAWGFPSRDSDFDVRFLYVRPRDWYLSIDVETKRDVIETPIEGLWDVNGWDVRKALRLLRKSNPPLCEWLLSPIVYVDDGAAAARLRAVLPDAYNPRAATYHYLHMARGNYRLYLRGERVRPKKYLYVLRPLLACRWLERSLGVVPMEFDALVDATVDDTELREAIKTLVAKKRAGDELDDGPRIPAIADFIDAELARHTDANVQRQPIRTTNEDLSAVFREIVAHQA